MDIALKQRLVGASVLIAFAVVVLPMLFGGRPDSGAPGAARIEIEENPEAVQFETRRFPIGEVPAPETAAPIEAPTLELPAPSRSVEVTPQDAPEGEAAADTDGAPVVPPPIAAEDGAAGPGPEPDERAVAADTPPEAATDAPAEPVTKSEPPPKPAPPSVPAGRYVVQVASFGSVSNASKLSTRLQGLGYAVLTDTVSSDVGTLNRVRVGPYDSESEAERAVARLREQIEGTKPRVMDLQPGRAERVTKPSDPLVRWVVQVGSFSSSANADNLVAKLRLEGHSAYREQVSSSGSTIYRVRVGPFVDRDDAIRADRQINERLALDGVVMSAD
ncbi:MAG: SPOR domain-containing protein [Xanthomonadales bacterium]